MKIEAGGQLGPYQIVAPIGKGGMGEVYRARDTRLDRDVAIKLLPESMARDAERVARFDREARLLASLNHPNIAHVYGFETGGDSKLLVLEFVEGETLADRLKRGPLSVPEALETASQIAKGLEAAHEKGVIHRDLKPGNVMLRPDGTVKVLDFGLARAFSTDASESGTDPDSPTLTLRSPAITAEYTRPGVVLGTAAYMSPEQARGKPIDKRTDIWSFGVVLLECLTARTPYSGETVSDSIAAILHKDPDWSWLPDDTPPTVHLLLRRCLAKDASKRLRDIGDARIDLENAIADPTSASLGLPAPASGGRNSRRRWSAGAVVIASIVALIAGATGVLVGRGLLPKPHATVRKYEIPLNDHGTWNVGQPAISPDGTMVAYVDQDRIWLRHLDSWDTRQVQESERGVIPFWSPDSRWLAFARGAELVKVDASGGKPIVITRAPTEFEMLGGGAWGSNGLIYFSTGDSGIHRVSADGGVAETYVAPDQPDDDDFHELALMPDGESVVFTVHSRSRSWYLAAFDGQERKIVFALDGFHVAAPALSPSGHLLFQRFAGDCSLWAVPFSPERLEATGPAFLVSSGDGDPTMSAAGTLACTRRIAMYFAGKLVLADPPSGGVELFADPGGIFSDHALSPDGKTLAIAGFDLNATDIWILDVESGSRTRLTYDDTKNEVLPRWSPDGREIAYAKTGSTVFERIGADDTIHFVAVDGSGETRPPIDGGYPSFDAEWKYIAFVRTAELTGRDIYWAPLEGDAEAKALLDGPNLEEYPALSPNGRWLAYSTSESGAQQVFLTRFPSGQGKWQVSELDGTFPRWSPDGTRLYFAGPQASIYEVRLETEPRVMLTPPRRIVDGPKLGIDPFVGLDFTAGGQRLIVQQSGGTGRRQAVGVIENWFVEFEGRQ